MTMCRRTNDVATHSGIQSGCTNSRNAVPTARAVALHTHTRKTGPRETGVEDWARIERRQAKLGYIRQG